MRIGVASHDGVGVSDHFGRSRFLLVFDVEDGRVTGMERRAVEPRARTGKTPDHSALLALARDCRMVVSGGMGAKMAAELRRMGVEPFIVAESTCSARTAVARVLAGEVSPETPHPHCCEDRSPPTAEGA